MQNIIIMGNLCGKMTKEPGPPVEIEIDDNVCCTSRKCVSSCCVDDAFLCCVRIDKDLLKKPA